MTGEGAGKPSGSGRADAMAGPLTRREHEVAALVAEGLSNRQIAERLVIAERTADAHVEHIRTKLGFRSRAQIAVWFATRTDAGAPVLAAPAEPTEQPAPPPVARRRLRLPFASAVLLVVAAAVAVAMVARSGHSATRFMLASSSVRFEHPVAVAVDSADRVYVVDGNRVLRLRARDAPTVAGTGVGGFSGDGGPATAAQLSSPAAIAFDAEDDLYIADAGNNRVRRVGRDGVVTTVAGSGKPGYGGDGGPATKALLNSPSGIAVGLGDSVYVADTANNRVRRISPEGIITTVAGTGSSGYEGDGLLATAAVLNQPQGLAADAEGSVYIADSFNDRIRKVDVGGLITTVAGDGAQGYSGDGGPATQAHINLAPGPLSGSGQALALDRAGDLFVADAGGNRVREVDVHGVISTAAGTGQPGYAPHIRDSLRSPLDLPLGVAVNSGAVVYVADTDNGRIRELHP